MSTPWWVRPPERAAPKLSTNDAAPCTGHTNAAGAGAGGGGTAAAVVGGVTVVVVVGGTVDVVVVGGTVKPPSGDMACIDLLEIRPVEVTLAAPLGARAVLDAVTAQPLILTVR
jgi:hypothetical protein